MKVLTKILIVLAVLVVLFRHCRRSALFFGHH